MENKTHTIQSNCIIVDGKTLMPYTSCAYPNVGDIVFWLDKLPFNMGEEHTSRWGIVTKYHDEMCVIDDDTEAPIDELYFDMDTHNFFKRQNPKYADIIEVVLTPEKYPIAFRQKLNELLNDGMSYDDAEEEIVNNPIKLELYYQPEEGLFAAENRGTFCPIYSPYTKEKLANYSTEDDI